MGVAEIYSATQYEESETFYVKQIYFVVFGLALLLLVVSLDYRILSQQAPYIYLGAVLLLLLALFIARPYMAPVDGFHWAPSISSPRNLPRWQSY